MAPAWEVGPAAASLAALAACLLSPRLRPGPAAADGAARLALPAAILVLGVAFGSPVAAWADRGVFSMRMLQQALLFFVAAPLLLWGAPRAWLAVQLRRRRLRRVVGLVTRPLPAILVFHLLFAVELMTPAFTRLQSDGGLRLGAEFVLFVTALCMWWPALSPSARLPALRSLPRLGYLFLNWLAITVVFAWIVFTAPPAAAAHAPTIAALTPLRDRQVGGFMLGVVSHLAYFVVVAAAFYHWARAEHTEASPLHLYRRVRGAGFTHEEASRLTGLDEPADRVVSWEEGH